jgi:hypothetical protein
MFTECSLNVVTEAQTLALVNLQHQAAVDQSEVSIDVIAQRSLNVH